MLYNKNGVTFSVYFEVTSTMFNNRRIGRAATVRVHNSTITVYTYSERVCSIVYFIVKEYSLNIIIMSQCNRSSYQCGTTPLRKERIDKMSQAQITSRLGCNSSHLHPGSDEGLVCPDMNE